MRYLYSLFMTVLIPVVLAHLWLRGAKLPAYRQRWSERFGRFSFTPKKKTIIWLHTVSVGELIAAKAVIIWLLQRGDTQVVVTTTTPTGSEQVVKLFGDSVFHVYAPYDLPFCVVPFLKKIQPSLAIFMETELWPNTIHYCHKMNVPTLLANGRLSKKSANGYRRVSLLIGPMLKKIDRAAVQHATDAERFAKLGLPPDRIEVTGSIKFDISLPAEIQERAGQFRKTLGPEGSRKILIAASTHKGEDELILSAWKKIQSAYANALLILVPRHPDRFNDVYRLCIQRGFNTSRRSKGDEISVKTNILLADTLGELLMLYGCADIAFVGGTLIENGGHNFLEPAAWSVPVVSGPSTFNFAEIARLLIKNNGMVIVDSADALAEQIIFLFEDQLRLTSMGSAARGVVEANRGALEKLNSVITRML